MIEFTSSAVINWIIFAVWVLCAIQAVRIAVGIVVEESGRYVDGDDILFMVVFSILAILVAPAVVVIRFFYWFWNYYEVADRTDNNFWKIVGVDPDVETKSEKKARKLREAQQKVDETRGKIADRA